VKVGTLLIALVLLPILVFAKSIRVEWGYTPPSAPAVSGFRLYQESVLVCDTKDPKAVFMDCEVNLTKTVTGFTLTAGFVDNTESPHSAVFLFTDPAQIDLGKGPAIKNISIN